MELGASCTFKKSLGRDCCGCSWASSQYWSAGFSFFLFDTDKSRWIEQRGVSISFFFSVGFTSYPSLRFVTPHRFTHGTRQSVFFSHFQCQARQHQRLGYEEINLITRDNRGFETGSHWRETWIPLSVMSHPLGTVATTPLILRHATSATGSHSGDYRVHYCHETLKNWFKFHGSFPLLCLYEEAWR